MWRFLSARTIGGRDTNGQFDNSLKGQVLITLYDDSSPEDNRETQVLSYTRNRTGTGVNSWAAFRTMVKEEVKTYLAAINAAPDQGVDASSDFEPAP